MPIYEFECDECGARFDKLRRLGDASPVLCPEGHAQVHRLFSQPAIIFKGAGFYVTDNKKSTNPAAAKNGRKKEPESSTAETKPETKKEASS
jgi:putative FmdB family regulatory protein